MTLLWQCLQVLLFLSSLLVVVVSARDVEEGDYLYHNEEPVIEFYAAHDGEPSEGDFRQSMKPKMVEFYNPYCVACTAYKSTYLKLAKDVVEEMDEEFAEELEIYAVSCQVHQELCDEYEIDTLPTLALFRQGKQNQVPGQMRKLQHSEKNPDFIVPYLVPPSGNNNNNNNKMALVKRGLTEAASDGDEANNEDEQQEENDNDSSDQEEEGREGGDGNEVEEDGEEEGGGNEDEEGETEDNNESEDQGGEEENENNESVEGDNEDNESEEGEENEGEETDESNEVEEAAAVNEVGDDADEEMNESSEGEETERHANDDEQRQDEEELERDMEEANQAFFESVGERRPQKQEDRGPMVKGAGAGMSREMEAEMDKWREAWKKQHEQKKSVFRRHEQLGVENQRLKKEHLDDRSGATKAMRAHMPGTDEYKTRQQKIQAHHDKLLRKQSLRTTAPQEMRFSGGAGGASRFEIPANHKPVVPYKKQLQKQKLSHKIVEKVPILKQLVVLSKEEELILDSSLSFMFILKAGLFSNPEPLNKHKKKAFQGWLDLLRVSLPPEWGLHEVIMDLDNNLDFISQGFDNLKKFLSRHELPRKEWSHSCTINGRHTAYYCGFWKLLHVVSVGMAEHRGGLNLVEGNLISKDARVFSPHDAAEAIKEFIANFFPCTECRNHFVAQYDECSNRRCVRLTSEVEYAEFKDWQEVATWLWEVHNDVNVKLLKEKTNQNKVTIHDEIKVLYPSLDTCLSCFRGDGGYDEEAIFVFLEKEYWPGASEIDPAADKLLFFHNTEYAGFAYSWGILFLGVGVIYMCRPRGVFKGRKKRAD